MESSKKKVKNAEHDKKPVTMVQAVNKVLKPSTRKKTPNEKHDKIETKVQNESRTHQTNYPSKQDNITAVVVNENLSRLVNVEYPGIVENEDKAMRTLGGAVRVSEVFSHPTRKLELKFRPGDVFCNPVFGQGRTTCGLLIKVRRKKEKQDSSNTQGKKSISKGVEGKQKEENQLIDLDEEDKLPFDENRLSDLIKTLPKDDDDVILLEKPSPSATKFEIPSQGEEGVESNTNSLTGPSIKQLLLNEEEKIAERVNSQLDESDVIDRFVKTKDIGALRTTIALPNGEIRLPDSEIQVTALGIINRCYNFNGVSDFQYLPAVSDEVSGQCVSIVNDIFPNFGDPEKGNLYDAVKRESGDEPSVPFCIPMYMSKCDKPMQNLFKSNPQITNQQDINQELVIEADETEVNSTRTRRSVYTHTVSFRWFEEMNNQVKPPQAPYPQALEDAASKMLTGTKLETIRQLFEQRPIWTKIGLEWETKYSSDHLKFLLPCVAYFTLNGPWRSLWIRFGYDPRKDKSAFIYQLIDYRLPFIYRSHQVIDQADVESYHKFKPDTIPPKCQMFYQFCDLQVPEIQELAGALSVRLHTPDTMPYNPKFGFLDEDIMEFCRYCMSRCVEVRLHSLGKIKAVSVPPISLEQGGIIPVDQLRVQPRKPPRKKIRITSSSTTRAKKVVPSEVPSVTSPSGNVHDESEEVKVPTEREKVLQSLTEYFDDDEEEEEEEDENYDEEEEDRSPEDPLGNLRDFDDEDDEEIENTQEIQNNGNNDHMDV